MTLLSIILTMIIVGFVTAGIGIRFDRFFTILLLVFLFGYNIAHAVNIFLWVIFFGALMVVLEKRENIKGLEKKMKLKLFFMIPVLTFLSTLMGSYLFHLSSGSVLAFFLGIIAVLYGGRLILIHFSRKELEQFDPKPRIVRFCGLFGPVISGIAVGFIGTSLKPLKIPFAVKIGRMNIKQVYMGNTVTSMFASVFALFWHHLLVPIPVELGIENFFLAAGLWTGIHYVSEITNIFFRTGWKRIFQILVGIVLLMVSIRIFLMV